MMAPTSEAGNSPRSRMKRVIDPGRSRVDFRHNPSTDTKRGAARASTRTMSLRHHKGRVINSVVFWARQSHYVAIETIHSL